MRTLLWVILALAVLVAGAMGCGRTPRYDARLVQADSLMRDFPDSALAVVEAVSPGSLDGEGDRAYRGLLLTQARYRCYVTATGDSAINRALAYYRRHSGERDKLTRAYIYKGAVMEELGHPDSAMLYYKHAEATAAPDDHFNLGYTKLRIGELYQSQISYSDSAIKRLYAAKNCFKILRDTGYIIVTDGILGAIFGLHRPDTAKHYLIEAIQLSKSFDPDLQYTYKSKLAGIYLYSYQDYRTANTIAMDVFTNGKNKSFEDQFFYYATLSYLALNKIDSAKWMLEQTPPPCNYSDSILRLDVLAEIAKAQKEHEKYGKQVQQNKQLTTNALSRLQEKEIVAAEVEFDKRKAISEKESMKKKNSKMLHTLISAAVFILLLLGLCYKMYKWIHLIKVEARCTQEELELLKQEIINEKRNTRLIVDTKISALRELYQTVRVKIDEGSKKRKKILPLPGFLALLNERHQLMTIELNESFWDKIKFSVNKEFNGIGSFVEERYQNLTENELKTFYLLCTGISPQIIKLCLNYTNAKTVTNQRSIIIKNRMGLDMSLEDFIKKYMNGEIN